MKTVYKCDTCGEYEDKILPIKEQKTFCEIRTEWNGARFYFTHKACGGRVHIFDNGVMRSEFVEQ